MGGRWGLWGFVCLLALGSAASADDTAQCLVTLAGDRELTRAEWIAASEFHPESSPEILALVAGRVRTALRDGGAAPVVIFDLDATLYDTGPRNYAILRDWLDELGGAVPARLRAAIDNVPFHGYTLADHYAHLKLSTEDPELGPALRELEETWRRRYASGYYVPYDPPYAGAVDYVRSLHALGARIVYLTGRDEPMMGERTRENLTRDGFPFGDRAVLVMKPSRAMEDLEFKRDAVARVREEGRIVASFENEPANLMALAAAFPDALAILHDTNSSAKRARPGRGIYRLGRFVR